MKNKKKGILKKIVISILSIIAALFLCVALFFGWLTIVEYRPNDIESVEINGEDINGTLDQETEYSILTWNVGYGALGDNADFFMDGGESVMTADKERVNTNLTAIADNIIGSNPDFVFLQEVDVKSRRSYKIDETSFFFDKLNEKDHYQSTFAYNFKVKFIPYPIPPIGMVNGGIMTLSSSPIKEASRVKLPCPFSWPVRLGNLKRCLLITRISAGDKELVLINTHLEAYDSGEGKIEQTRILKEILNEEIKKGNYVIAGGDFNQTFSNIDTSAYPTYEGKWQCGNIEVSEFEDVSFIMDNRIPTCRSLDTVYEGADKSTFQYYMIDGFIVSDNIEIINCETLDYGFKYSDHNPVLMKFKLR
ncbi:MAG: endonuclease [Lachnospiraceae bacterium]|nr:endonuclease [Lachnospiraceae bacterium]